MNSCSSGERLTPSSVKIAGLWKRSQGLKWFAIGKPNYRHRVFILTDYTLSYYSGTVDRIGGLKGRISLDSVRAVEFVDESAFRLAHSLQVIYYSRKHGFVNLYITARDQRECADWVTSIRKACCFNQDMLMHYHPGAHVNSRWSCCHQQNKLALGCHPTYHFLARSSSRYADMRRSITHPGRLCSSPGRQSRLCSTCASDGSPLPHINEEGTVLLSRANEARSSSCGNLVMRARVADGVFPPTVSHLSLNSSVRMSICTSDVDNDSVLCTPVAAEGLQNQTDRQQHLSSWHQVVPTTAVQPHLTNFQLEDKSSDKSTRNQPVVSSQIMLDTRSRNSSVSEERNVEISVRRKSRPSIEPRVSDSNPDVIHV